MPPTCPNNSRVVIGQFFCGNSGQYICTGASSFNFPCSHNCMAAGGVMDLEMEPIRYRVCAVACTEFSRSAMPKPSDHTNVSSSTTATESPGTFPAAINAETSLSIADCFSVDNLPVCATAYVEPQS